MVVLADRRRLQACFGCDQMDDPNYRGTWKNTSYTFDWSQYARMLTTFDWTTQNMCPLIDVTALPDTTDPCKSNGYRAPGVTPPDQVTAHRSVESSLTTTAPQTESDAKNEPNWKQWLYRGKLGFNPIYAQVSRAEAPCGGVRRSRSFAYLFRQLEAKLDLRGRIAISPTQFEHRLFAGAIVEVSEKEGSEKERKGGLKHHTRLRPLMTRARRSPCSASRSISSRATSSSRRALLPPRAIR